MNSDEEERLCVRTEGGGSESVSRRHTMVSLWILASAGTERKKTESSFSECLR